MSSTPRATSAAGLLSLLLLLTHAVAWSAVDADEPESRLVGAQVRQVGLGTLHVYVDGEGYLIPLVPFAELAGVTVTHEGINTRLETPLGEVNLEGEDLREVQGDLYLPQQVLEQKLATPVVFDQGRYALDFDLPWRPDAGIASSSVSRDALVPEVGPPGLSLSTLQSDMRYTEIEDDGFYGSSTVVGGRMGPGYWRTRLQSDFESNHVLRDYTWFHQQDRRLYLAGNQRVRMHPLLRSIEMTGLQFATTNQPLGRFRPATASDPLLSRQLLPTTAIDGFGPAAGVAELRVNGTVVERQRIDLDGRYEFHDVSLPARRASEVQVFLYDRRNLTVPIEVIEESRTASEFLLPEGKLIHMAGAGIEGNLLQRAIDSDDLAGPAGFYQSRYGLSERFTVEGAVLGTQDAQQTMAGMVYRLGPGVVTSLGLGVSRGSVGYAFDLEGVHRSWRLLARSRATEDGFAPAFEEDEFDHYLELGRRQGARLDMALVGRSRRTPQRRVEYLLPALAWHPVNRLALRGRPDSEGDYRFDLSLRAARSTRLGFSTINDRAYFDVTHRFARFLHGRASHEGGDGLPERQELVFSGYGGGRFRPSWDAGLLIDDGEEGYLLGARVAVSPGIFASARYETDSRDYLSSEAGSERLLLNVTADLGFSRGRVVAARSASVRRDRGGIAGRVLVERSPGLPKFELGGLLVKADGHGVARTDAGGGFFVGGIEPGIYRFELETGSLPIELAPLRVSVVAEVAAAAVTSLDFQVRPEFGLAGRLVDAAGRPVAGVIIEALDANGTVVRTATTDQFGLYRVDGLPVGQYTMRTAEGQATRPVEITGDFLFDQNLQLPATVGS